MVDLDREFHALDQLDPPDVWEEAASLDVGKPLDTAPPRHRGLTITVAFAVFAAAAVLLWNVFAPRTTEVGSTAGWQTYRDPVGWTMRYPGSWHLSTFRGVCMAGFSGAMVSNIPDAYNSTVTADGCYWPPNMAPLPSDGVVVEFDLMQGGPAPGPLSGPSVPADTPFPLSLDTLQPAPTPGTDVRWYTQPVQVGGNPHYTLNVWIGPGATEQERETASAIVASISASPSARPIIASPVGSANSCRPSQLSLRLGPDVSEATQQNSRLLALTNMSAHRCELFGYPTIQLVTRTGHIVSFRYQHRGDQMVTDARPERVPLTSGQTAYVMINKGTCEMGDEALATEVHVIVPGRTSSLSLAFPPHAGLGYCGPGPQSSVHVSPFEATEQGTFAH